MSDKRIYHIIIGSKAFFDLNLPEFGGQDDVHGFLELVKLSDAYKQNNINIECNAQILFLKNDNYHGIVDAAHDRLGALIEELTASNAEIYIHNPPKVLYDFLKSQHSRGIIELSVLTQKYSINKKASEFAINIKEISEKIIGQEEAINEISKSLWYLTTVKRTKPYVIMLYGNSSLGKTELVREIADKFFDGKFCEKHLSMFKNNNYSDYFFGDAPNRKSLGYDLLERESNLIFFDELDKCPEYFYSAFYTLFDNVLFKDSNYDVDVSGALIVLTSNYHSEEEMKKNLGLPIFYRIDKFIHFNDFSCNTIHDIVLNEILSRKEEYQDRLTPEIIYAMVSTMISTQGENARTIKNKVQQVVEELLFKDALNSIDGVYSDREEPLPRSFRASFTEDESHPHEN
ncbi:AAA family ATPase [Eubacterium sp.]|uniref:AAA family ATPase n=1 Tax=Eubacterium sp. TaxID=142586 RepID=UPI002FC7925E